MKITHINLSFLTVLLGSFLFHSTTVPLSVSAAEKTPETSQGGEQNVEKLLYTLNGALEENRKIRKNMQDLQDSFEKITIEKSDLSNQLRALEQVTLQKNKDSAVRIEELKNKLDASQKEVASLQNTRDALTKEKEGLESAASNNHEEIEKLKGLLDQSILEPEKGPILEQIKKNDTAVDNVIVTLSGLQEENLALKNQLISAWFQLGNLNYELGHYGEAITFYQHILKLDPDHPEAHHNLAIIYDYHLGEIDKARREYQIYLNLKPPSEKAGEVRIRLWDLNQLSRLEPTSPLKKNFQENQRRP